MKKKMNKTILLASTFFLTSLVVNTNSFASEDYKLDLDESLEKSLANKDDILSYDDSDIDEVNVEDSKENLENNIDDSDLINDKLPIEEISSDKEDKTLDQIEDKEVLDDENKATDSSKAPARDKIDEEEIIDENIKADEENKEVSQGSKEVIYYNEDSIDDFLGLEDSDLSKTSEDKSFANNLEDKDELNLPSKKTKDTKEKKDPVSYDQTDVDDVFPTLDIKSSGKSLHGNGSFINKKGKTQYYENHNLIVNASLIKDDKFYTIDSKGIVTNPKNEWGVVGNKVYFTNIEGKLYKGFNTIYGKNYFFNEDGSLSTAKKILNKDSYLRANEKGELVKVKNEWIKENNKVYRTNDKGDLMKGLNKIGNDTYNFAQDGSLITNTKEIKDDRYILTDNLGKVVNPKNTWFAINGLTYRTGNDGKLLKGIANINNNTYLFDDNNGSMIQNKDIMKYGKFFQIDKRGVANNPKNAWINFNNKKYHTNENGYIQEGVWKIDKEYYYFSKDGLQTNTKITQQGVEYIVDENGRAKAVDNKIPGSKNLDKMIDWMYTAMSTGMEYSMDWRERVSEDYADCSSAVYRSMIYGGFLEKGSAIGNTETLFKLGAGGKVMYEIKESDIRYGDIFVAGYPGGSMGAAGHTGFILNKNDDSIIHMNYSSNGVSVTPRKGYMGDSRGLPVKYFRLVGGNSDKF